VVSDLREPRILVTAFEPWADRPVNASQVAVEGLDGTSVGGCLVRVLHLPVVWEEAPRLLLEEIAGIEPSAIVCFGMHKDASWRVELLAHNRDVREGTTETPIVEDAPWTLPTGLPVAAILGRLLDAGLPALPSEDAGVFLCNHAFYWAMHAVQEGAAPPLSGFVHVPAAVLEEKDGVRECRNADQLQEGARLVVEAVANAVGRWRTSG
jgi:pyroglutamyl-peptidase